MHPLAFLNTALTCCMHATICSAGGVLHAQQRNARGATNAGPAGLVIHTYVRSLLCGVPVLVLGLFRTTAWKLARARAFW